MDSMGTPCGAVVPEGVCDCHFSARLREVATGNVSGMIRHRQGSDFLLIEQDEHARLSGWLAEHLGNAQFAGPDPREQTIRAIGMHDCSWPLHDHQPTLNKQGLPLHVLETPMPLATR